MVLDFTREEVLFIDGMDQSSDSAVEGAGGIRNLYDGVYSKRFGVAKRKGFQLHTTAGSASAYEHTLLSNGKNLATVGADNIKHVSKEWGQVRSDQHYNLRQTCRPAVFDGSALLSCDIAYYSDGTNEYACYVTSQNTDAVHDYRVRVTVVELDSDTVVLDTFIAQATRGKVVRCADSFHIYAITNAGDLYARQVDMDTGAAPALGSPTLIQTAVFSNKGIYDVVGDGTYSYGAVVSGTNNLIFWRVTEAIGGLVNRTITTTAVIAVGVTKDEVNGDIWAVYSDSAVGGTLRVVTVDAAMTTTVAGPTALSGTGNWTVVSIVQGSSGTNPASEKMVVAAHNGATVSKDRKVRVWEIRLDHTITGSGTDLDSLVLLSKLFTIDRGAVTQRRRVFACVTYDQAAEEQQVQHSFVVMLAGVGDGTFPTHSTAEPVAVTFHDRAYAEALADAAFYVLPNVVARGDTMITAQMLIQEADSAVGQQYKYGTYYVEWYWNADDAAVTKPLPRTHVGSTVYTAGALPKHYDGEHFGEQGLVHTSHVPTLSGVGSGTLASGTYNYKLVFVYETRNGDLIRSAPSAAATIDSGMVQNINVQIIGSIYTCLDNPSKHSWRAEVYRTAAGPGPTYYRAGSLEMGLGATTNNTFVDSMADSDLENNAILYTEGNELVAQAPPALHDIEAGKDRLFGIGSENRRTVYFTKQKVEAIAPEWNSALRVNVDGPGGDLHAIAYFADTVYLFQENDILAFSGEGPNNIGEGAFGQPERVVAGVGCTNPQSVAYVPMGVVFRSRDGMRLLANNFQVYNIGEPVADALGSSDIAASAAFPDRELVVFLVHNSRTLLVLDYSDLGVNAENGLFGLRWYIWTFVAEANSLLDVVNLNGLVTVLYGAGTTRKVYQESATAYDDAGVHVPLRIDTQWFKGGGQSGAMRVRDVSLLFSYVDQCKLWVDYYIQAENWDPTTKVLSHEYTDTKLSGDNSNNAPANLRLRPKVQRCRAVRLEITEKQNAGANTAGLVWHGYAYNYGVLRRPGTDGKGRYPVKGVEE